jgi:hypothetical protein
LGVVCGLCGFVVVVVWLVDDEALTVSLVVASIGVEFTYENSNADDDGRKSPIKVDGNDEYE